MQITIKNFKTKSVLGVYPEEKVSPREILVSLNIGFDGSKAALSDDLNDTLDYDVIGNIIHETAASESFNLIESLVKKIADNLQAEFEQIKKLTVKITKPGILTEAEQVSVKENFRY